MDEMGRGGEKARDERKWVCRRCVKMGSRCV